MIIAVPVAPRAYGVEAEEPSPEELPSSAVRPHAPWMQIEAGATPLDGQRRALRGRFYAGLSAGYRWDAFGTFLTLSHDTFVELLDDAPTLRLVHVGPGAEHLWFAGRVRSSVALGASVVTSREGLAERGSVGWFVDIRPSAFRFPVGSHFTIEWTPLMFDVTVPAMEGIPLILPNYMTVLAFEWSLAG
jgi:hypothetical protein